MKIAHLVSTYPPYHGGMGNMARDIARSLVVVGEQCTILTPTIEQDSEEVVDGVRVLRIHSSLRYGNAALCPWILKWVQGYDIIHLHWPFIGGAEWVWWGSMRKKFISEDGTLSRIVIQYHMDLEASGVRGVVFPIIERIVLPRLVARSSAVATSSDDYRNHSVGLNQFRRTEPPLYRTIPLGVDLERFCPRAKNPRLLEQWAIPPLSRVIGFVGAIDQAHYFKGLDKLIAAVPEVIQTFPNEEFILLIIGSGDLLEYYQSIVRDAGLNRQIRFVGSVGDDVLPEYYHLMDCLVLPSTSRSEAFGIVLLEAMASGIPIIASDLPGVRTLVEGEGVNGRLIKAGDADAVAEGLVDLFEHAERLPTMGIAGRARAESLYDWNHVVRQWQQLYRDVIAI